MSNEKKIRVRNYLNKFGYFSTGVAGISPATPKSGGVLKARAGAAEIDEVAALKRFQTFADVPVTGRINKATEERMEKPRCGFPDVTHREMVVLSLVVPRWPTLNITYGIQNTAPQLPFPQVRQAIRTAFDIWASAVPFQFREILPTNGPNILIRFASGNHGDGTIFDGPEGTLAHAFPPNPGLGGMAGDVHFDASERWGLSGSISEKDLISVAAHEIGHSLGLAHSPVRESLMYAIYEGAHRFLHADDVNNIRRLYSQ